MSAQVLVIAERARLDTSPLRSFRVKHLEEVPPALDYLVSRSPRVVVFGPDLANGEGYAIFAGLESRDLRIPVLVEARLPEALSPVGVESAFLHWVEPGNSSEQWFAQVLQAIESAENADLGPMFSVYDLLRLAVGLGHSTALAVGTRVGEIRLEIVGGDVWSAESGRRNGLEALVEFLLESPLSIDTVALRSVPSQRPLKTPGAATLRRALALLNDRDIGTSPIQVVDLRATRGAAQPLARDPSPTASPELFDEALAAGISAALARDFPRAIGCFERALEMRPNDPRALYNLGRVKDRKS